MARVGAIKNSDEYSNRIFVADLAPETPHADDDEFLTPGAGVPTGWTEYDPGNVTTVSVDDYGLFLETTSTGQNMSGIYKAPPSGDFSAITHVRMSAIDVDAISGIGGGIVVLEDTANLSTSDNYNISLQYSNSASNIFVQSRTAYNGAPSNPESIGGWQATHMFVRFRRISTTWYFDYSEDGISWCNIYSVAQPWAPTGIGPYMNKTYATVGDAAVRYPFFRFSTDTALKTPVMGRWARILID